MTAASAATLLATAFSHSADAGSAPVGYSEAVAQSDMSTPSGDGDFLDFGLPILNADSQVGFFAEINNSSSDQGVYLGEWIPPTTGNNPLLPVARVGDQLGGKSGQIATLIDNLTLTTANDGRLSFTALTSGSSETGLFFGGSNQSGANPYAVQGDAAPPNGGPFNAFFDPIYNQAGEAAFRATVNDPQLGNVQGLYFTDQAGNIVPYAISNTATPDGDTAFGAFSAPSLSDSGTIAFRANRNTFSGIPLGQGIYYADPSGNVIDIAHTGEQSPDGNGNFLTFGLPTINPNETVVFTATLSGGSASGLYGAGPNAGLFPIRRAGDTAPSGDRFFRFNDDVRLNAAGDIAFSAVLDSEETGLFRSAGGTMLELAQTGQATPFGGSYGSFGQPSISETGAVAFYAALDGSGPSEGIFVSDGLDTVAVVSGDLISGVGEIQKVEIAAGDPGQSPINERNQVAYRGLTSDGTTFVGLFTPDLHFRRPNSGVWNNQSNWTLTTNPDLVHRVFIDPDNTLSVLGPNGNAEVLSLSIGNGNGTGALQLQANGLLKTIEGTTIGDDGELAGEGSIGGGAVVLLPGGRIAPGSALSSSAVAGPLAAPSAARGGGPPSGAGEGGSEPGSTISIQTDFCVLWTGVGEEPEVELNVNNASDFDQIEVAGTAKLAGKLNIVFPNPMDPPLEFGDELVVIDGSSLEGVFSTLEGLDLDASDGRATPVIYDEEKGDVRLIDTVGGDANGDFVVDLRDLDALGANWNDEDTGWSGADFNNDQGTDLTDLDLMGQNWGIGSTVEVMPFEQALASRGWNGSRFVPEPTSAILLAMGSALGLRRRR